MLLANDLQSRTWISQSPLDFSQAADKIIEFPDCNSSISTFYPHATGFFFFLRFEE